MSERFIIQLAHQRAEDGVRWARINAKTQSFLQEGFDTLGSLHERVKGARLIVLLPSADVLMMRAQVPTKSVNKVRIAVPNVLEEAVSEPLDELHFALGAMQTDFQYPVAVINKAYLRATVGFLTSIQLNPHELVPSVLSLPLNKNGWSAMPDQEGVLVRTGEFSGFVSAPSALPLYIQQAIQQEKDIHADSPETDDSEQSEDAVESTQDVTEVASAIQKELQVFLGAQATDVESMNDDVWTLDGVQAQLRDGRSFIRVLAEGSVSTPHINLLQGDFKPKRVASAWVQKWRWPIIFATVLLVSWLAVQITSTLKKERALDKTNAQIESLYRSLFPTGNLVNPRVQLEQKLNVLKSRGSKQSKGFLPALDTTLTTFAFDKAAQVERIGFRNNALNVQLRVANNKALETIRQRIASAGYSAEIVNSELSDGAVLGTIKVE